MTCGHSSSILSFSSIHSSIFTQFFLSQIMALLRFNAAKSSRGKILLTNAGFEYAFEALSKAKDGWEYWRCPCRSPYCPGRACVQIEWHQEADGVQYKLGRVTKEHNHPATFGAELIRVSAERLRQEARSEYPTSSRNIVSDVRSNLPLKVRVASAPGPSCMRWTYNYHRRKQQMAEGDAGLDAVPTRDIVIPDQLVDRVIYNQNLQGSRMIIFCSQFGINTLRAYRDEVAVDGTFETSPRGFDPARIKSDFEAGSISAARQVFPESEQSGCLFHFGQAIFRRIQTFPNLFGQFNFVRTWIGPMQIVENEEVLGWHSVWNTALKSILPKNGSRRRYVAIL